MMVMLSLSFTTSFTFAQPLTLTDIMHFSTLQQPVIAEDGSMMAVEAKPDRGESSVIVKSIDATKSFNITNGTKPKINASGRFVIATIPASLLEQETKKKSELTQGLALLDTKTGKQQTFTNIKSAQFNDNGQYLAVWFKSEQKNAKPCVWEAKILRLVTYNLCTTKLVKLHLQRHLQSNCFPP